MKRQKPIPAFLPAGLRAYRERGGGINRGFLGNVRWRQRAVRIFRLEGSAGELQVLANGGVRIAHRSAPAREPRG